MNATDELRRMLDERGVEWRGGLPTETMVEADGLDLLYVALPDGRVRAFIRNYLTPEQAIAATLGAGTCRVVKETKTIRSTYRGEVEVTDEKCSECGGYMEVCTGVSRNYCPNCGRKVVYE